MIEAIVVIVLALAVLIIFSKKTSDEATKQGTGDTMENDQWVLSHIPTQQNIRRKKSDYPIKKHFRFEYVDEKGDQTSRIAYFHFLTTDKMYREKVFAFCFTRNEHREFFVHKMMDLVDVRTQEKIIDKIEYLKQQMKEFP